MGWSVARVVIDEPIPSINASQPSTAAVVRVINLVMFSRKESERLNGYSTEWYSNNTWF